MDEKEIAESFESAANAFREIGQALSLYFTQLQPIVQEVARQFSHQFEIIGILFPSEGRFAAINLLAKDKHGKNRFKGKARKQLKLLASQYRRGIIQ